MEDTTKLVEEQLLDAQEVAKAGEFREGMAISGEGLPSEMSVASIVGADKVTIYDTETGKSSIALRYMLKQLLSRKRVDGSRVFTTAKPAFGPKLGTLKCLLHTDNPQREHYTEMGFPICRKSNLVSPYQVKRHMMRRHPVEWQAMEDERLTRERLEDREAQQKLYAAVGDTHKEPDMVVLEAAPDLANDPPLVKKVIRRRKKVRKGKKA